MIDLISNPSDVYLSTSARDDYIRFSDEYECWLFNPSWQIKPSIAITSEGAFILTCQDHDKGTK